jgi:hypothetical protein
MSMASIWLLGRHRPVSAVLGAGAAPNISKRSGLRRGCDAEAQTVQILGGGMDSFAIT